MREIGFVARPSRVIVLFAITPPIDICKNRETVAILGPKELHVFIQRRAQEAIQTDADSNMLAVHERNEFVQLLGIVPHFDSKMSMNVDHGKFRVL
jgi:hypothetical protein